MKPERLSAVVGHWPKVQAALFAEPYGMMRSRREEGFVLVVVLVMMMALASLAFSYSLYVSQAATETLVPEDRLMGEAAIRAALSLAVVDLQGKAPAQRPSHGGFAAQVGAARIQVTYRAENARIDLNAAPKEWLSGLFVQLGWPRAASEGFASHIVAWRTIADALVIDNDANAYRAAKLAYPPKQAPFDSLDELGLVVGLPPDLPRRASPYLTIYNGQADINVAEADPVVLAAWPELPPAALSALLAARASGADGKALIDKLGAQGDRAVAQPGQAFRAKIEARLRRRTLHAEIVFTLNSDALNAYEVLDWRDDFDLPLG